jgi:hypothetical protein
MRGKGFFIPDPQPEAELRHRLIDRNQELTTLRSMLKGHFKKMIHFTGGFAVFLGALKTMPLMFRSVFKPLKTNINNVS